MRASSAAIRTLIVGWLGLWPALAQAVPPLSAFDIPDFPPGRTFQFKATETGIYDTNPLLQIHHARSILGSETVPELIFRDSTPLSQFMVDASLAENLYNDSNFNSTDAHGTGTFTTHNERFGVGLTAKGDYDTVRSSELTTFGLGLADVRHTGVSAAPQFTFSPNAAGTYSLAGSVGQSSYDNSAFTDYRIYALNPSYLHHFNPDNSGSLTLNAQRYETTQGSTFTSDTVGPSLGWTSVLSPRLTSSLSAGFQNNTQKSDLTPGQSKNLTYTFNGAVAYKGQQNIANALASRSQQPFGTAREALVTAFSVDEKHLLNETVALNAASSYEFAQYSSQPGVNLDNLLKLSAGLSYRLIRDLDANATYQYTSEKLTTVGSNIKANTVLVGLTYHPPAGVM